MNPSTQKPCPRCGGSGTILDDRAFGDLMREARKARGLSVREIARRVKWSPAYVSDLELGKRMWTHAKHKRYEAGLKAKP